MITQGAECEYLWMFLQLIINFCLSKWLLDYVNNKMFKWLACNKILRDRISPCATALAYLWLASTLIYLSCEKKSFNKNDCEKCLQLNYHFLSVCLQVKITVEISFFEIYNEKIHDLLASSKEKNGKKTTVSCPKKIFFHWFIYFFIYLHLIFSTLASIFFNKIFKITFRFVFYFLRWFS